MPYCPSGATLAVLLYDGKVEAFLHCDKMMVINDCNQNALIGQQDFDPESYIVKPLFWLGMYGMIPAFLIGLMDAGILRVISRKAGDTSS